MIKFSQKHAQYAFRSKLKQKIAIQIEEKAIRKTNICKKQAQKTSKFQLKQAQKQATRESSKKPATPQKNKPKFARKRHGWQHWSRRPALLCSPPFSAVRRPLCCAARQPALWCSQPARPLVQHAGLSVVQLNTNVQPTGPPWCPARSLVQPASPLQIHVFELETRPSSPPGPPALRLVLSVAGADHKNASSFNSSHLLTTI